MIRDVKRWQDWVDSYEASQPLDYQRNLEICEAMWEWACRLGALPLKDPLEGIGRKIELARRLDVSKDD